MKKFFTALFKFALFKNFFKNTQRHFKKSVPDQQKRREKGPRQKSYIRACEDPPRNNIRCKCLLKLRMSTLIYHVVYEFTFMYAPGHVPAFRRGLIIANAPTAKSTNTFLQAPNRWRARCSGWCVSALS